MMRDDPPSALLPDPSLPAVRAWFWRTVGGLAASLTAFLVAGWLAGRYIFPHGTSARFLLGALAIGVAFVLVSLAGRVGGVWLGRIMRGRPLARAAGQMLGVVTLGATSAALSGVFVALGPRFEVEARFAVVNTAAFVLWLGVLLCFGRGPRRRYPEGASLRRVWGPGPFQDRRMARAAIANANARRIRPRDIDAAILANSLIVADEMPPDIEDQLYAYYAALDRDDLDAADALLREMTAREERQSRRMRSTLAAESALFQARYQHEASSARDVLRRFRGAPHDPEPFQRAAAAIFLCEGRRGPAKRILEDLRESVTRRRSRTGLNEFLYDQWAMMLAESAMPPSHLPPPA